MKVSTALENLRLAEEALKQAKGEHEEEFRRKLVALCNEYGLLVAAGGSEGSRLEIVECTPGTVSFGDFE